VIRAFRMSGPWPPIPPGFFLGLGSGLIAASVVVLLLVASGTDAIYRDVLLAAAWASGGILLAIGLRRRRGRRPHPPR